MDLSIVSGTYNRIQYLKNMIASARHSVDNLYGFSYEFVIVDGGSQDGTPEWCQSQPDIRFIQHGALLGAVKAFNDGAFAATGQYVILANDDIEFIGDSILRAWIYMQQHPQCGGGCFLQDRNRQHLTDDDRSKWHVESMPAVQGKDGKFEQVHVYYAQVGIFPKWLGDLVHWWCDEDEFAAYLKPSDYRQIGDGRVGLHTYGGDNELSARIIDLGFHICPISGTKITDKEAKDDLRKINNITGGKDPKSVSGHHPDSWKWGKKWFRRNQSIGYRDLAGPIIRENLQIVNRSEDMTKKQRILYLPIYEPGWTVQKKQKYGLRDALAKVGVVEEVDYFEQYQRRGKARLMGDLEVILQRLQPTLILTQLHNGDILNAGDMAKLRANSPAGAKFVNWNGDYWPEQLLRSDGIELARAFDLMTVVNRDVEEKHRQLGINCRYWQIGWEPEGRGYEPEEYHDIVFLASGYSSARQKLGRWLKRLNVNLGLYGNGWPAGWSKGENLYNFREACKIYRGAKISIGDSQWPESGFVSNRVMQSLAAGGSALAHQWFRGMELLGLVDGQTCIIWRDLNELDRKISYYLSHEDERKKIALAGERLALNRHSFDVRVSELLDMLGFGAIEKEEESWRW